MAAAAHIETDREIKEAWEVHQALVLAEFVSPVLRDNPRWNLVRMDAYEAYHLLMEGRRDGE